MTPQMMLLLGATFVIGVIAVMSVASHRTPNVQTAGLAAIGGPFTLVDHTGKTVTDKDYRGKFMLVFFGYTFCPDVCPTELNTVGAALDKMGPAAEKVVPIFVTVDPQRDTVDKLKSYVADFHPRLVGLTGSEEQVAAAAKAYKVYYKKVGAEKASADYLLDHSSYIYLMGPDGAFVTHFPFGITPEKMAEDLQKYVQAEKGASALGDAASRS
jgi:cytochrome oxidase Cu insertion factor (SCO1/SenC/PrrC family)